MEPNAQLVSLLAQSRNIMIFTGAGISTGSGIPDFRGPSGVWKTRQPVYYQDFMDSESARIEYWDQKAEGWEGFKLAKPNAAHLAVVKLDKMAKINRVVTQNIDGLHEKAGIPIEKMVELHGTNLAVECQSCGDRSDPDLHFDAFIKTRIAPTCHKCNGYLKPATISFGQSLREGDLRRATKAAEQADLVISMGSTLSVQPAASFPLMAAERGVPYVIINQGQTDHDHSEKVSLRLEGDVVEIFPAAVAALEA